MIWRTHNSVVWRQHLGANGRRQDNELQGEHGISSVVWIRRQLVLGGECSWRLEHFFQSGKFFVVFVILSIIIFAILNGNLDRLVCLFVGGTRHEFDLDVLFVGVGLAFVVVLKTHSRGREEGS